MDDALREVRVALLEADVALDVVKDFIAAVRKKAVRAEVVRSVAPAQMVIRIVHDQIVEMLGAEAESINIAAAPPAAILMVGLQGSGKTTTTAKIGLRLTQREKKQVLMASLDVHRPAAEEQLRVLGEEAGIPTLPVVEGQMPADIARRAMDSARLRGVDVVLLDTAGRLHVDEALMAEAVQIRDAVKPVEILLVGRCPDRARRGEHGESVQGTAGCHRYRAHPHRRRRPGRRCPEHAGGHRLPDQTAWHQ